MASNNSKWEVVIGLETHTQLKTKSKIFSGSSIAFGAEPNVQANAVDIALPGVLPVLNKEAVNCAVKFGLAIHAQIAPDPFLHAKIISIRIYPRVIKSANTNYLW